MRVGGRRATRAPPHREHREPRQANAEANAGNSVFYTIRYELLSPKLCRRKLFRSLQTYAVSTMVLTYANSALVMKAADEHSPILSNAIRFRPD